MPTPRISFGMIVLNGEPFLRYNLRSLYPFAHEIIVVEGASPNAASHATSAGHSLDKTLEVLQQFKSEEDPDDKLRIVTAEQDGHPNGFWPGEKDQQSQAYAHRASGDWLWQIDVDEFYMESDMRKVVQMLADDPTISAVSFPEIPFWGSIAYRCDGVWLRLHYSQFHRLFKWGPGFKLLTHRPPTVINNQGVDLRTLNWVRAQDLERQGIYLYHYTQLFPKQVVSKSAYYDALLKSGSYRTKTLKDLDHFYENTFVQLKDPYHVHTVNTWPSWLVPYTGEHPAEISNLFTAIERGEIEVTLRDMTDVEKLLTSRRYKLGVWFRQVWANYVTQSTRNGRDLLRGRCGFGQFIRREWSILIGRQRLF